MGTYTMITVQLKDTTLLQYDAHQLINPYDLTCEYCVESVDKNCDENRCQLP